MVRTKGKAEETYQIRLTRQTQRSINQIVGYIAHIMHEPQNAIRVGNEIFLTIERIGKNPFIFRECEEMQTENKIYRKAVCLSWLIIYRINNGEVLILDILHGSRNPQRIKRLDKIK